MKIEVTFGLSRDGTAGWSEDPVEASQRIADLDALLELIASHQDR